MVFQVLNDDGTALDAHYNLEGSDVIFHNRGFGKSNASAVNSDYAAALELILTRVLESPLRLERAWVDSSWVQATPLEQRVILTPMDLLRGADVAVRVMISRMGEIGRLTEASEVSNSSKRLRIRIAEGSQPEEIEEVLRGRAVDRDLRSLDRLPAEVLRKVSPDHVWNSVQSLLSGYKDHPFPESTKYDLIADGYRLDPKAVFGLAATEALGFPVLPRHFSGGVGTVCFEVLEGAGFEIVRKGEPSAWEVPATTPDDKEWAEGRLKLVRHLKKERAAGLAKAKKASFVREHGRLFCERCGMDPKAIYGEPHGEACIEVHHKIPVEEMDEDHRTRLEDLLCLCANCHRVIHRLLKEKE